MSRRRVMGGFERARMLSALSRRETIGKSGLLALSHFRPPNTRQKALSLHRSAG
jgi:hypothetical protein